jgi:DNA/RNA endonuclease YhcR with UshA esterase domain
MQERRKFARERRISEVDPSEDVRVRVVGTVVAIDPKIPLLVLDDGTGSVNVLLQEQSLIEKVRLGNLICVVGIVLPHPGGYELRAEVIQDMQGLDKELYGEYMRIREKLNI